MKKLFLIILLFVCMDSYSQIDKAVNDLVDSKTSTLAKQSEIIKLTGKVDSLYSIVNKLAGSLDSSVSVIKTVTGAFNVDTIRMPINTNSWYLISLSGEYVGGNPAAVRMINVSNTNGVYKIISSISIKAFTGLTSGAFDVAIVNGWPVVKITSSATVKWYYKKTNI